MEPDNTHQEVEQTKEISLLHQVTPLSKYLAMVLLIILPFVGGYVGYVYAPEKVVEVEKVVTKEVLVEEETGTNEKVELETEIVTTEEVKCGKINTVQFEGSSYHINRLDKTVIFTSKWVKPDYNSENLYQGCIGESIILADADVESFSYIDQFAPVSIGGTRYQNVAPLNTATDPVTPLAYDKNNFYINGVSKFSVASGTFEMYQPNDSGNYYVRLGDEEFELQSPIDVHLIKID